LEGGRKAVDNEEGKKGMGTKETRLYFLAR